MKCRSAIPPLWSTLLRRSSLNGCSGRNLSLPLLLLPLFSCLLYANGTEQREQAEQKIELLIQEFSVRLGITADVIVSIVPKNSRLVSVEYAPEQPDAFRISFEQGFLNTLDHGEVRAAVAHEMGHIWIFTHFPYLHTEALANQQAVKLVSRGDLGRVYEKVREWNEKQGNLGKVLGCADQADSRLRTETLVPCADAGAKRPQP